MMMAMMLPSAAPMILLFAVINRKQRDKGAPYVPTGISPPATSGLGRFQPGRGVRAWALERSGLLPPVTWRAPACCSAPAC